MRINPAVIALSILTAMTIALLVALSPKTAGPIVQETANAPVQTARTELSPAQITRIAAMAEDWPAAPSYETYFNALDPSYEVAAIGSSLFDPADDYWGLPRDQAGAYELVDAYCGACHSLSIVMQQRATPERWAELLTWMEDKQGMAAMPPEDHAQVLDYLGTHFTTQ